MKLIFFAVVTILVTAACTTAPADTPSPTATAPVATPIPTATATTEPTATATPSPTVACGNPSPAPNLLMFSDGAGLELVIEWTGGPADATGWQYRTRLWDAGARHPEQGWGDRRDTTEWTDIPPSAASTCSYRIPGLRSRWGYEAQVRALTGNGAEGTGSNVAAGTTQPGDGRTPMIGRDEIVKGDGVTRWQVHGLGWTIVIPDSVLIRGGGQYINGPPAVRIYEHTSGSSLHFFTFGVESWRSVRPGRMDIAALFDEIAASVDPPVQQMTPALYAARPGSGDASPMGDDVVRVDTSRGGSFELTIPAGARLTLQGPYCHPRPECFEPGSPFVLTMITVVHVNTGSELLVVLEHIGNPDGHVTDGPWEVSRVVTVRGEGYADVNAAFDAVVASLRRVQEPSASSY